jgi:DNA-binding transcriptional MocR family regulator
MRTVDDFAALRRAHREGLSIRQIAKQFGVGRDTVRKALQHPEPQPYTRSQPRFAPIFGPFQQIADAIVADDDQAPRKQRRCRWLDPRPSGNRQGVYLPPSL